MPPRRIGHLGEEPADHALKIPVTRKQFRAVKVAAGKAGLTVAAYVRALCAADVGDAWPPERETYRLKGENEK